MAERERQSAAGSAPSSAPTPNPETRSDRLPAPGSAPERQLATLIQHKAQRRLRARLNPGASPWFGLGLFGLVGWSVAVPSVIGIALGLWLDERFSGRPSWTLTLLFVGVVLGCLNAWYWIQQERRDE